MEVTKQAALQHCEEGGLPWSRGPGSQTWGSEILPKEGESPHNGGSSNPPGGCGKSQLSGSECILQKFQAQGTLVPSILIH